MDLWNLLLQWLGFRPLPGRRGFAFDSELQVSLESIACGEGRSEDEVAADVITTGLTHYHTNSEAWKCWQKLSPREQDVAALACLGYANKQIALRLRLSCETVKTHMHNLMRKFGLRRRTDLADLLAGWDFSAWDPQPPAPRR